MAEKCKQVDLLEPGVSRHGARGVAGILLSHALASSIRRPGLLPRRPIPLEGSTAGLSENPRWQRPGRRSQTSPIFLPQAHGI